MKGKRKYHDAKAYKLVKSRRKKIVEMERHLDNLHANKYARDQRRRDIAALRASLKTKGSRARIPKKRMGSRTNPIVLD